MIEASNINNADPNLGSLKQALILRGNIEATNAGDTDDERIQRLVQNIDEKKKYLMRKYHTTYKATAQNNFLEGVLGDYTKYRQVIVQQKENQIKALETINDHIQSVRSAANYSKKVGDSSDLEHQRILNEIRTIKTDLDRIIQGF
jgi:hypothetical protein